MTKKIYFFAVMTALFLLAPATLLAASSGDCGDNVKWNLDDQGVLTIEGTGAMTDFASMSNIPWDRSAVTTVVIKEGVTTIGSLAFNNCTKLTSVTIPNTVTSIGSGAFATNQKLTSVDIPNSVTTIGEAAFNSCTGLTSVTLPNSLTSIADWLFSECTGLTSVEIPNSVTSIGQGAFSQCSSLASVNIPSSVTSIGVGAFGYTGLTKIESQAENPPACGKNAFAGVDKSGCKLYVPEKSMDAYKAADGWKDFINVEALADGTESGTCGDNIKWTLDSNGVLTLEGTGAMPDYTETPQWKEKVTKAIIGEGITSIGNYAFRSCYGLTSVTIPNSVTSIGEGAFAECFGLTSVTIPAAVTSIGEVAFYNCIGLTKIVSLAETPPACGEYVFAAINFGSCELAVPEKSIDAYKAADGWKDFTKVVSGISSVSKDNNAAVSAKNGAITVTGAANNALVEVYSTSGALVYRGTSKTVAVPSTGIYIVKAAGKTFKVNAAK